MTNKQKDALEAAIVAGLNFKQAIELLAEDLPGNLAVQLEELAWWAIDLARKYEAGGTAETYEVLRPAIKCPACPDGVAYLGCDNREYSLKNHNDHTLDHWFYKCSTCNEEYTTSASDCATLEPLGAPFDGTPKTETT